MLLFQPPAPPTPVSPTVFLHAVLIHQHSANVRTSDKGIQNPTLHMPCTAMKIACSWPTNTFNIGSGGRVVIAGRPVLFLPPLQF
jgi:hypothetical protein